MYRHAYHTFVVFFYYCSWSLLLSCDGSVGQEIQFTFLYLPEKLTVHDQLPSCSNLILNSFAYHDTFLLTVNGWIPFCGDAVEQREPFVCSPCFNICIKWSRCLVNAHEMMTIVSTGDCYGAFICLEIWAVEIHPRPSRKKANGDTKSWSRTNRKGEYLIVGWHRVINSNLVDRW